MSDDITCLAVVMPKWFSQQKQLPVSKPTASGEFEQLFRLTFAGFRLFALTPGQMVKEQGVFVVRSTRWMRLIVCGLVLFAWIALVESFFVEQRTALITGIANHIQLITNTIAMTVALIGPQLKASELQAILDGFLVIDRELTSCWLPGGQHRARVHFLVQYGTVLFGLLLLVACDGFVSFSKPHSVEVWYWIATQLPFIVQAMAVFHAFLLISWLHGRFQHLNALVEQHYRQGSDLGPNQVTTAPVHLTRDEFPITNVMHEAVLPTRPDLFDDLQILAIVSRTIDQAQKIESYFGSVFLTVYTALFTVTTIQSYYCYLHLNSIDDLRGLSIESLILSGAIILANVITIVALPYICERVEHESKLLMSFLSKLSMRPGQTAPHSSIWFSNLISSVRFSALGFFTINYNMLSGFVAGLVTYLIIFIQFNSMVPAAKDEQHYTRSKHNREEYLVAQPHP